MQRVDFMGTPIDVLTMRDAVDAAESFIAAGRPHQLIAINAAKVVLAHQEPDFRQLLWNSDMAFVDGQPVIFAARLLGYRLPELISGHFLMERLVERAAERNYSVYFLGARPEVVAKTVDTLAGRHPSLRVAGWRDGFWTRDEEMDVVRAVRASGADMLFLALGTPRKEQWIARYKDELQVPVCLGVGGSFDVIAGVLKVEPAWMRSAGLAWLYRMLQEPGRLGKRYAASNPIFIRLLLGEMMRRARAGLPV